MSNYDEWTEFDQYDCERTVFDWVLFVFTAFTNLVQLLVIWLIIRESPKMIHEYRFYLTGMTISDLLFGFSIGFVIEPKFWMPDSMGLHAMGLARFMGPNGDRFGEANVKEAFDAIKTNGPQFRDYVSDEMNVVLNRMSYKLRFTNYSAEQRHTLNAVRAGLPIIYFDYMHGLLLPMYSIYGSAFLVVQCCALFVGVSLIRYLSIHQQQFSQSQSSDLQMRLIKLLVIQIIEPFVFIAVPVLYTILLFLELRLTGHTKYLSIRSRLPSQMAMFLLIIYSLINSLLIILFVTPYRQWVIRVGQKLAQKFGWTPTRNDVVPPQRASIVTVA